MKSGGPSTCPVYCRRITQLILSTQEPVMPSLDLDVIEAVAELAVADADLAVLEDNRGMSVVNPALCSKAWSYCS